MIVRGVELELHPPPDYVSDVIRATGDFYEAAILDEIARCVTGGVLIDVGAMIGNHTAYLDAFVPHDGLFAFEPVQANLRLLELNTNPYTVTRIAGALSDKEGWATMTLDPANKGHAAISPTGTYSVPTATLDSFEFVGVSLLKIDVEGHERQVLAGARETIERSRPLIVIEDWSGLGYGDLLPGYELAVSWEQAHQTFLYAPS